jgi:hypothetical protein
MSDGNRGNRGVQNGGNEAQNAREIHANLDAVDA